MANPVDPIVRFQQELERVEECARRWAEEYPDTEGNQVTCSRVVFVEGPEVSHASLGAAHVRTPAEYGPRFAQLLQEGRCDWINFQANGVLGDALVLVVEHGWDYPVSSVPPENIWVMPCGPAIMSGFVRYPEPSQ